MSTNFYHRPTIRENYETSNDLLIHIGKRCSAGLFCHDCCITLCKDGNSDIHVGRKGPIIYPLALQEPDPRWHQECPNCGQKPIKDEKNHASMIELGFDSAAKTPKTAVKTTSSFSWAVNRCYIEKLPKHIVCIEDEYGATMTPQQFLDMLTCNCQIQFTHSVGLTFS